MKDPQGRFFVRPLLAALAACLPALPAAARSLRVGLCPPPLSARAARAFGLASQDRAAMGWVFSGLVCLPPGSADPAQQRGTACTGSTRL